MIRMRDLRYSSAILILMISASACSAPKVITPEISRKSYAEIRETQPDCRAQIMALEAAGERTDPATGCSSVTNELVLDALYCYRRVWKHWENEYRVLDAGLDAMESKGGAE